MATPDFNLCDVCGAKMSQDNRLFVATGLSPDPSGNGSETDGRHVDLCGKHLRQAVLFLLKRDGNPRVPDYDRGVALISHLKLPA